MNKLLFLLNSDNFRTYNVKMANIVGSANASILLSELIQRYSYHQERGELIHLNKADGEWFYFTYEKAEERTALSRYEQDTAIKKLEALGFIKKIRAGQPGKRHFQINQDAILQVVENESISNLRKSSNLDCGNPANYIDGIQQSLKENYKEKEIKKTTNRHPAPSKPSDFSSSSPYQEIKAAKPQAKTIDPIPELEQLPLKDVTKRNIYRDFTKEQILAAIPAILQAIEEGRCRSVDAYAYDAIRYGYKEVVSQSKLNIKYFEEKKKLHADFVNMNRNEKTVQIDLGGNTPREISLSDPDFKQKLDESLQYLAPKPNLEGKPTLHTPMVGAIGNLDQNITLQKSFVKNMAQIPFSGPQIQHNMHSQNEVQVKNCTLFQSPIQRSTIPKLKEEIPESEELIKNRQEAKSLIEQNRELLSQKGIRLQARAKCILIERIDHRDIGINTRPIEYDSPDFKSRIDSLFADGSISHSNGPPFA